MDGFSKHKNVKELIGCFNTEQRKGFDIVLSLLYETFSNIDCWAWDDNSSRISFGSKKLNSHDGNPIFGLVKNYNSIIFRVSSASEVLYREMVLIHGSGWERKALRHNVDYHFNLDNVSKDSSSLRKFLEKMSQVNVVCERANGNQNTPDDYPQDTPDDSPKKSTQKPARISIDGDSGCADKQVWAQINRRRGQAAFRELLKKHYDKTCAISGCKTIEALEAAHIIPHSELIKKDYSCNNGLLLRADIHTLYDLNLIGVDQDGLVHVSPRLDDSLYKGLNGKKLKDITSEKFIKNLGERFIKYKANQ
jgi:hypothetical protein